VSGLLQRVADQALGAHATRTAARIRPAMSVHAQVPMPPAPEDPETQPAPRMVADGPGWGPRQLHAPTHAPGSTKDVSAAPPPAPQSARVPDARSGQGTLVGSRVATRLAPPIDSPSERPSGDDAARLPPPLLDEEPVVAAPPAIVPITPPSAASLTDPASAASTGPTEVHVHIGRIEVMATPETAAPKKRRAPIRNALSLSDYLAKRRRP